jgi:ATP-dependent Clp protease adaptor protein ClpS
MRVHDATTTATPVRRRKAGADARGQLEDMCQVVLFNDDHNTMEHVVECLMRVFGHPTELAGKIMLEAHERGRAVAEVEGRTEAAKHRDQLVSFGLTATVETL